MTVAPDLALSLQTSGSLVYGYPFTYQLCATDADIPANMLTYSLLSGAPAGLNLTSGGQLSWTPAQTQVGSYTLMVRVTDSNPEAVNDKQLAGTNSFVITVATDVSVLLSIHRIAGSNFEFTISGGRIGTNYMLQAAPALIDCPLSGYWQDLLSVKPTSMPYIFNYGEAQFGTLKKRFYRLRTQ